MVQATEKVTFTGAAGDRLAGRLDKPLGPVRGTVLFAHCFTCTKDILAARRIASALTERGFAVLRFDFTGLGHSEGEFANTGFSSNVEDLVAAADFLRGHSMAPTILVGHSMGGAAVLAAAAQVPEAVAVATIAAPADPAHVTRYFNADTPGSKGDTVEATIANATFSVSRAFLDDLRNQSLKPRIASLGKALLIMHAPLDDVVGIENAGEIFAAAKHPKSFISLDGADHLLTRPEDAVYVADVLAAWASRYIKATKADAPGAKPGQVVVREADAGPFAQTISAGGHVLHADEPEDLGGDNTGPSPYDLLLAGLGACTSMTMRMYANHKKLNLDRITVTLTHEKIHAKDCAECDARDGKIDVINRTIRIEGDLDSDARTRLMEIADKCPVHRTIKSDVQIRTIAED